MDGLAISPRLLAIAEEIGKLGFQDKIYDIGTDHAYLPLYLLKAGLCGSATATDVSMPSLERAQRNAAEHGMAGRIDFRLGDGLSAIPDYEAGKPVVMAGIGGKNLAAIIGRGIGRARSASMLILQPMHCQEALREWLFRNGFAINYEKLAREGNRIYSILFCTPAGSPPQQNMPPQYSPQQHMPQYSPQQHMPPQYSPEEVYIGRNVIYGTEDEYRHFLRFTRRKIMNRHGGILAASAEKRLLLKDEEIVLDQLLKIINNRLESI